MEIPDMSAMARQDDRCREVVRRRPRRQGADMQAVNTLNRAMSGRQMVAAETV